jgi:hypothetical protein
LPQRGSFGDTPHKAGASITTKIQDRVVYLKRLFPEDLPGIIPLSAISNRRILKKRAIKKI